MKVLTKTLRLGLVSSISSLARITGILLPLLILLEIAQEFGWLKKISQALGGLCRRLGLPPQAAVPVAAGLFIGFTYSAGVLLASVKEGDWAQHELTLLWVFLSLSHAIFEDTVIFAALGLPLVALLLVRLVPTFLVTLALAHYFRSRTALPRPADTNL